MGMHSRKIPLTYMSSSPICFDPKSNVLCSVDPSLREEFKVCNQGKRRDIVELISICQEIE